MRRADVLRNLLIGVVMQSSAFAQTTLNAPNLPLKSSGASVNAGDAWRLTENGYVGTYITVPQAGMVQVNVSASGNAGALMNLAIGDQKQSFTVGTSQSTYSHEFDLPAGTYLLRAEFPNDVSTVDRRLQIDDLIVSGATVVSGNANASALAAADTYVQKFRKGSATIQLPSIIPGTPVRVRLKRHAFDFGTALPGTSLPGSLMVATPATGSSAAKFQAFVKANFNTIVPENAGKWAYNEGTRDSQSMQYIDRLLDFAEANGMRARMHTAFWDNPQEPEWTRDLLARAASGNVAAKNELRAEMSERIQYYVRDRAHQYQQLDVLNEGIHQPLYMSAFGADGVASVFNEVRQAAGPDVKLYVNEYNVLQYSAASGGASDSYANWYRQHVDQIREAGGAVGGVGVQYYAATDAAAQQNSPHSAARISQVLANLSVSGLPISMTEFGVKAGSDPQTSADILEETMRLVFGSPNATTFMMWGFYEPEIWASANAAALLDADFNLTPAGRRYQALMAEWNTDLTVPLNADRTLQLEGFFGEYEVIAGDQVMTFDLAKGTTRYTLVPEPAAGLGLSFLSAAALRRKRERITS